MSSTFDDNYEQDVPQGTKKYPWYRVKEYSKKGEKIREIYFRYTLNGIWMTTKKPDGVVVDG